MFEGLFQPLHLMVIFLIALVVFGPKKLPELGKGLGEAIRGFKKALEEKEPDPKAAQAPQQKTDQKAIE
jgi:sec-independent protein translocase protein TatA